ncbi:MAG: non-canonical purine NTP pyrophosphatase [Acidobacteriota bacterium]
MKDRVPFTLVTGNPNKVEEAERIVGERLERADIDLPEIQSLDLLEVLRFKAEEAYRLLQRPVAVEETGLALAAMGGFPGPLIKWMLDAMGPVGVARAALALGNPGVRAECALAYFDGERLLTGVGHTDGTLIEAPRGDQGFGWDPVFLPVGHELTYAELSPQVKDEIGHRGRAWRAFRVRLEEAGLLEKA